ncbi:hypothetical protein [Plantactinospora sonchi]|uniref:Gamma-glutamylcyclotransferase n=1 Tax=Plantactinospora sonchi TaxID=1544735 RepID=A0ABU7S520_9ACTN
MPYYFLIFGALHRGQLRAALAALVARSVDEIDIADEGDLERDWTAPVLCTVSPVAGQPDWQLEIYLAESVARHTEPAVGAWLADRLRTVVIYPGQELRPSAYWLVGPEGRATRARIYDDAWENGDGTEDGPVYRIDAVEHPVPTLPDLPVAPIPEVIRDHRMPTPVTDRLRALLRPWLPERVSAADVSAVQEATWRAWNRLSAWEGLVARMAAGWPPDGWYPATHYREDLELRDELVEAGPEVPEPVRAPFATALGEVDRRFETLTGDDGGGALAAELGEGYAVTTAPDRWWWRRIPDPVPWRRQPGGYRPPG